MISNEHRFHRRNAIAYVYRRGKTVRGTYGSLKFVYNSRGQTYRAAVVVSRKVHKSAVVRNRIRRRVYEVIRSLEPKLNGPYDFIFTVYSENLATMDYSELATEIKAQLQKAEIL